MRKIDWIRRLFIIIPTIAQVINAVYMIIAKRYLNTDSWPEIRIYADIALWTALGMMVSLFAVLGIMDIKYNLKSVKDDDDPNGKIRTKEIVTQLILCLPLYYSLSPDVSLKCFLLQVCITAVSPYLYYRVLVLYKTRKGS